MPRSRCGVPGEDTGSTARIPQQRRQQPPHIGAWGTRRVPHTPRICGPVDQVVGLVVDFAVDDQDRFFDRFADGGYCFVTFATGGGDGDGLIPDQRGNVMKAEHVGEFDEHL